MTQREFHPYCTLFPLMNDADLEKLTSDIKENGLREPIVITEDGRIIDGRNRYMACISIGLDPLPVVREGTDRELLPWVFSRNLHRRHLNESQRAMLMARLKEIILLQGDHDGGASLPHLEKLGNVSERSIKKARKVINTGSKPLQKAVENGEVSVSAAHAISDLPKSEQNALLKKGPDAIIEASRPEEPKEVPLGSFTALRENWMAASPTVKAKFREFIGVAPLSQPSKPENGLDNFGRPRVAPGSLLKEKGTNGKHGKVEK